MASVPRVWRVAPVPCHPPPRAAQVAARRLRPTPPSPSGHARNPRVWRTRTYQYPAAPIRAPSSPFGLKIETQESFRCTGSSFALAVRFCLPCWLSQLRAALTSMPGGMPTRRVISRLRFGSGKRRRSKVTPGRRRISPCCTQTVTAFHKTASRRSLGLGRLPHRGMTKRAMTSASCTTRASVFSGISSRRTCGSIWPLPRVHYPRRSNPASRSPQE